MKKIFKQAQKGLPSHCEASGGFTLIETLIAIFILTLTVGGLLTLAAGGYFSVRYARNQIVADNLIQESLEYIRNTRDGAAQAGSGFWQTWQNQYTSCQTSSGCIIDPYTTTANAHVQACPSSGCPAITFWPSVGFYGYKTHSYANIGQGGSSPYDTSYIRTVTMKAGSNPDEVVVTASMTWFNGSSQKSASQSILLANWNF
ncbi:MAG TPA: hypothetical protein VL576_02410 [Candidatus Paceibacterota bacterium]|jgi:type II secretory pathway pseudopilin PulG|nr:hypothetical protein [Candidatus Paceibacterota bacterium]